MTALSADRDRVDAPDVRALHAWLADQRGAMVDDLVDLTSHETPSDDHGLLEIGLTFVESWVTERLGEPATRTIETSEAQGSVLVLDYPGETPGRVVGLGHYDTVFASGTLSSWPVAVDGDTVTGPGVFDMKSGLVQLVWAVRCLDRLGVRRPTVRLVLNGDEEIGSPFSRALLEEASDGADAVLVFEASVAGAVKTARKGVGLFTVTATGLESHAGLEPEAGVSAVNEIAHVITTLHDGTDLARGTTVNVGIVHGGTRPNVMAGSARAALDVRVTSEDERARIDRLLASLRPSDERAVLEVTGGWNRPVMVRTEGIATLYRLAHSLAAELGLDLQEASVGGASDGNFVAAMGVPVLDGLGAVGGGAHARHEHISIRGMIERAALAAAVIAALPTGVDARS